MAVQMIDPSWVTEFDQVTKPDSLAKHLEPIHKPWCIDNGHGLTHACAQLLKTQTTKATLLLESEIWELQHAAQLSVTCFQ